jgi:hypothetical protein
MRQPLFVVSLRNGASIVPLSPSGTPATTAQ